MSSRTLRLVAAALVALCAAIAVPAAASAAVSLSPLHRGATAADPVATEFAAGDKLTATGAIDEDRYYQWYLYDADGDTVDSTSCTKAGGAASNPVTKTWTLPAGAGVTPAGKDWDVVLYQYGYADPLCWFGWTSAGRGFVIKRAQTVTLSALADRTYGDGDVTPVGTASSGLPVSYSTAADSAGCAIVGGKVRITGVGTCKVVASQGGNATYLAAPSVTRSFTIAPKPITGTFTASDKQYDGGTSAAVASRALTGVVSGDAVTLTGGTASFATPAVAAGKTVTLSGATLTGAKAASYTLTGVGTTTAAITPKELTGSFTVKPKEYDGTTAAEIDTRSLATKVGDEDVTLVGGTAAFADADSDTGKTVTGTGFALGGADAGNYTLVSPDLTSTGDIAAKELTGTFTVADREYDGTTDATVTGTDVTGELGDDEVTFTVGSASFADKTAGVDKVVTGSGFALGGDTRNYAVTIQNAKATITKRPVSLSIAVDDKDYDGTKTASFHGISLFSGVVGQDLINQIDADGEFASADAGRQNLVLSNVSFGGPDAGNYTFGSVAIGSATIRPKPITGSFTAKDKVYDGDAAAEVDTTDVDGEIAGDDVSLTVAAPAFADDQAGTDKDVTGTASLAGADQGNYTLGPVAPAKADITPKGLTGSFTAADKVFDGTTAATITGRSLSGAVAGDTVALTGGTATFADAAAGTGKTVTGTGFGLAGADRANYALTAVGTAKASITPAPVAAQPQAQTPAQPRPVQATAPSTNASASKTKLTLTSFKASSTCVTTTALKSLKLSFKLSRAAKVTFTVAKRNPSMARKTCGKLKTVRSDGKYDDVSTATTAALARAAAVAQSKAGLNTVTLKSVLGKKTLAPGTYRVLAYATDADGTKTVLKKVVFRVVG